MQSFLSERVNGRAKPTVYSLSLEIDDLLKGKGGTECRTGYDQCDNARVSAAVIFVRKALNQFEQTGYAACGKNNDTHDPPDDGAKL